MKIRHYKNMKKKIRESKNNLKRNMSYELTIFNDNGIQETFEQYADIVYRNIDVDEEKFRSGSYGYANPHQDHSEKLYKLFLQLIDVIQYRGNKKIYRSIEKTKK